MTAPQRLAALANGGTGFRYAGVLTAANEDLDFRLLSATLDTMFRLLQTVIDAATDGQGV